MVVKLGAMLRAEHRTPAPWTGAVKRSIAARSHTDKTHCSAWLSKEFKIFKSCSSSPLLHPSHSLRNLGGSEHTPFSPPLQAVGTCGLSPPSKAGLAGSPVH